MSDSPRATSVKTTSKHILYSPAYQWTVPHMHSSPRVCTLVLFINPRRAGAARVTVVGLSVCLSVCVSTLILALQATRRPISDTSGADSELREPEKLLGDFPEMTSFERYAVKTSEKVNCIIALGLPRPDPLALCTLGASHNEWHVSTPAFYLLL